METILKSLGNPEWWFTIVFSALFAVFLNKVIRNWKPWLRDLARGSRARSLRKIQRVRLDAVEMAYAISRANAYFMLFLGLFAAFFFMVLLVASTGKLQASVVGLLAGPVVVAEIAWVLTDSFVKEAMKLRARFFRKQGTLAPQKL